MTNTPGMPSSGLSLLQHLVGKELPSVIFVMDYVQFDFNGPRLSCYVWPTVELAGQEWRFGQAGYRDELCRLITREVTDVRDDAASGIVVTFGEASLVIKPELEDLPGPEIAMLMMGEAHGFDAWSPGAWTVWRPEKAPSRSSARSTACGGASDRPRG